MSAPFSAAVRSDLWNAILDYRSGQRYVWDGEHAIPIAANTDAGDRPIFPTLTESEFVAWKRQFANSQRRPGDVELDDRLNTWAERNLPTKALPPRLQGHWNADLKTHIAS